jgi:polysaccharide biosynthesis transport protein
MELGQAVSMVWKWRWLVALATLVAVGVSAWADSRAPRVYKATTTLMVGQVLQTANPQPQDFTSGQQLAQTYVQLARRRPVLEATINALALDARWEDLVDQVSAAPVPGTQFIQISAADTDPARASILADEVGHQLILQSPTPLEREREAQRQFVNQQLEGLQANIHDAEGQISELEKRLAAETSARGIQDIQKQIEVVQGKITAWQSNYAGLLEPSKGGRINYMSVVEPATIPTVPVSPQTLLNILLAAAIGAVLAVGAAFLLEYADDSLKTDEDVQRAVSLPTLGTIARIQHIRDASGHLVTMRHPLSPITEAYRVLRTNVQFTSLGKPSTRLLITSSGAGEGKTTTACNLGIAMAQAGKRVILCDGDLRRPSVHRFFGLSNRVGLTSLLLDDDLPLEAALFDTPVAGLKLMPSGPLPPNPGELLGSKPMQRRLAQLDEFADVVVFDSPSVGAVADASILGSVCSGVILVVAAGRTRRDVVQRAKAALDHVGLKVFGVVLNKRTAGPADGHYPSYAHGGVSRWRTGLGAWIGPAA